MSPHNVMKHFFEYGEYSASNTIKGYKMIEDVRKHLLENLKAKNKSRYLEFLYHLMKMTVDVMPASERFVVYMKF